MKFFELFRKKEKTSAQVDKPEPKELGPHMSDNCTFGMHLYRSADEDSTIYFLHPAKGIRKKIVDWEGRILDFPGVEKESSWAEELAPNALKPQIRFRTSFEKRGDRHIMLWQVQPDGRYWEDDDGFGAENEEEITLYTYLDDQGRFTGPFRLYRWGRTKYLSE